MFNKNAIRKKTLSKRLLNCPCALIITIVPEFKFVGCTSNSVSIESEFDQTEKQTVIQFMCVSFLKTTKNSWFYLSMELLTVSGH